MTHVDTVSARVTRHFDVAPELVFDAWLDPDLVAAWFEPGLGEMVRITLDTRVGGRFSIVQRRLGEDIDHIGEYREIVRPRRLIYTWAIAPDPIDSSTVYIAVVPLAKGCDLTLVHEMHPDWTEFVQRVQDAWTRMLDAMASALGSP